MKMTKIRLVASQTVDLPIIGADESGPFVLKSAEGLGPPDITVKMGQTVLEKAVYGGKTVTTRQPILLVGLQPAWDAGQTPEALRTQLYSLLTPRYNQMVQMQIMNENAVQAYAQGQISKLETVLFTKDPAVQITMECDYGYLLAPNTLTSSPAQRTINTNQRAFDIENVGSAPSGFRLDITLRANVGDPLTLSDDSVNGMLMSLKGINWVAGDRLVIDTRPGQRGVWRGPNGGNLVSVLNNLDGSVSSWMSLYSGVNTLILNAAAFDWNAAAFQYQPAYWGV